MTFFTVPLAGYHRRYQVGAPTGSMSNPTYIASSSSPGIDGNDDTTLESERQCRSSVLDLDPARWVCMIIRVEPQECSWLYWSKPINVDRGCLLTSGTDGMTKVGTPLARLP